MPEKKNPKVHIEPDKTVIKALALAGLDRGWCSMCGRC